jgi:hypothetical protein
MGSSPFATMSPCRSSDNASSNSDIRRVKVRFLERSCASLRPMSLARDERRELTAR